MIAYKSASMPPAISGSVFVKMTGNVAAADSYSYIHPLP